MIGLNRRQCFCLLLMGRPTSNTTNIRNLTKMAIHGTLIIGIPSRTIVTKTNYLREITMLNDKSSVKAYPKKNKDLCQLKAIAYEVFLVTCLKDEGTKPESGWNTTEK